MERFFYATYIRTSPEDLWEALTSPEFTTRYWWGRRLESDWIVGSSVRAVYEDGRLDWQGKVLEYHPYTRLSYTFHLEEKADLRGDAPSVVLFQIATAGPGIVKLIVTHEGLSERGREDVSQGWPPILSSLKSMLESGKPLTYEGHV
jgi:uncharacterized protein YndB with AHSA1/START domain